MKNLDIEAVKVFVEQHIPEFHNRRLVSLQSLELVSILKRKNPYLFRAKNILTASDLVKTILDAHLSSQEETIFGDFLESLAIFICGEVYGGKKSSSEGIDLEFTQGNTFYIVSIKSGPNWGNSNQISKMKDNFRKAKIRLRQNRGIGEIIAVNGCCYGRDNKPDKGDYLKLCGQRFWEFISGDQNLYTDIIQPLGHKAKEKNEEFAEAYAQIINLFTVEFTNTFCTNGLIDWKKLVMLSSSANTNREL